MEANLSDADERIAMNHAVIVGELVTEPDHRSLPGGSEMMHFSLTVRVDGEATTSVPLGWLDAPARARRWKLGDHIVATGPVVRRFYQAGGATRSQTEVSVRAADLCRNTRRSARILAQVEGAVTEAQARFE